MSKIIIGLTGLAGAGKSTAARFLEEERGFSRVPFAGPLKRMALDLGFTEAEISTGKEQPCDWFALPRDLSSRQVLRAITRIVPFGWAHPDVEHEPRPMLGGKSVFESMADLRAWYASDAPRWIKPRVFLQRLGTEWGRQRIHPEIWVEAWRHAVAAATREQIVLGCDLVVADDCRFENEAAAIRAMGGKVVRIERPGAGSASGASHASETGVEPDITIQNDGPPEVLRARILGVLDRYFAAEAI